MLIISPAHSLSLLNRMTHLAVRQTALNLHWGKRIGICYGVWFMYAMSGMKSACRCTTPRV